MPDQIQRSGLPPSHQYRYKTNEASRIVIGLARNLPDGMTILMIRQLTGMSEKSAGNAVRRLFDLDDLIRQRVPSPDSSAVPYVYWLNPDYPPEPAPARGPLPSVPGPRLTAEAGSALRIVRQLKRPGPEALAAQVGCSYPQGRRIWAELLAAGLVG